LRTLELVLKSGEVIWVPGMLKLQNQTTLQKGPQRILKGEKRKEKQRELFGVSSHHLHYR
jgi:hypothetical protein